ncbi:Alpha/beta hydrolase fold-1 [Clohesyomyces aquaticus]|uniref:Alpha/beta hydrolase fold-1 n=1 Tax=Clohesyomyces aquaticus TaxID=1231657 RepID=A0A1Y1Y4L9_9PLEO|nr:Alpha/beta hydrolase fold-1 [Clohesyomyces aquaticus]
MSLPTIVLVPGAWHSPVHYTPLIDQLKTAHYDLVTDRLPSVGSTTPKEQSVANDASHIRKTLLGPLLDAGKDIILLMHSYGGCPGADAAKGLSKSERTASGQKGGIVGLVFICAFVAAEGDSLLSKLPGNVYDSWVINDTERGQLTVENPKEVFYNGVDEKLAEKAIADLLPQAEPALSSPSGPPAWPDAVYNGKRAYIQAEQDHSIPFVAQDAMVTYSGVEWDVKKLNSSHSPFMCHTKEVAEFIVEKARAYAY